MPALPQALRAALASRRELIEQLHGQGTDCYRLFHGSQEGAPGLTLDRYGPQLLVQSFHEPLDTELLPALAAEVEAFFGHPLLLVYNDRSRSNSRVDRAAHQPEEDARTEQVGHEWGLNYRIRRSDSGPLRPATAGAELPRAAGHRAVARAGRRGRGLFRPPAVAGLQRPLAEQLAGRPRRAPAGGRRPDRAGRPRVGAELPDP